MKRFRSIDRWPLLWLLPALGLALLVIAQEVSQIISWPPCLESVDSLYSGVVDGCGGHPQSIPGVIAALVVVVVLGALIARVIRNAPPAEST